MPYPSGFDCLFREYPVVMQGEMISLKRAIGARDLLLQDVRVQPTASLRYWCPQMQLSAHCRPEAKSMRGRKRPCVRVHVCLATDVSPNLL